MLSSVDGASFPDVAADSAGDVWVAWSSTDDEFDTVFLTNRSLAGGEGPWAAPVDVIAEEHLEGQSYVARPVMDVGADGSLYLGAHAPGDKLLIGQSKLQTALDPQKWSVMDIASGGYHIIPRVTADSMNALVTQRTKSTTCPTCLHLLYMSSYDGGNTWMDSVDISRRPDKGAAKPQMIEANDGSLHVVWESGDDGDRGYVTGEVRVQYAASQDGGASWSVPVRLDMIPDDEISEQIFARNPVIGQTGKGTLVAAWWQMPEDQVYYRTSTDGGQTWNEPHLIPSVWGVGERSTTRQDSYSMVQDSRGNVHLLMAGRLGPDDPAIVLMELTFDGSGWSPPRTFYSSDRDLPEWPRAATVLGNQLAVVWHVRPGYLTRDAVDDGVFQVWESHVTVDSPAVPAVALPAIAGAEDVTDTASLTVSGDLSGEASTDQAAGVEGLPPPVENFDRATPESPISSSTLKTENDDVRLLLLSLLPAVALVALGLWWRARRS